MIYPGSHANNQQSWNLYPESLNLEPVTSVECCLSLEKHLMKIETMNKIPPPESFYFLFTGHFKNQYILLEKSGFPASLEKTRCVTTGCSVLRGNDRPELSLHVPLRDGVCSPVPSRPAPLVLQA